MAFLVARIIAQKDPCVHPFQKWTLRASVFESVKTNIWIRTLVFTNGFLQQRMAPPTPLGFRLHAEWFWLIIYPIIDKDWIMEPYRCCRTSVVKTKVSVVRIQMLVFTNSENRCMQGLFLKRMHARGFWGTDVRNQKGHLDDCTQRTFGQQMRARYGANPRCAQPTSQVRATLLTVIGTLTVLIQNQKKEKGWWS